VGSNSHIKITCCARELENRGISNIKAKHLRDIIFQPASLKHGSIVQASELEDVIRLILREVLWCKLIKADRFYVHFGWDYYMYIGSTSPSSVAINHAEQKGIGPHGVEE
jgi:hypothetical protein